MKIIKSFNILNREINFTENIGFIPTMGSLHNGHLHLIQSAKKKTKKVLVSIFVNPSQFNKKIDFDKYPRNIKKDIKKLKRLKVNFLFIPNFKEIYKKRIDKKKKILEVDKILCAKYRIGHFQGVLAVISRLLENIPAKYLFLGDKDFQQIYLIKKYLSNKFKTKIITCKTIRNKELLPLSSRNILLSKKNLKKSEKISKLLLHFHNKIKKNFKNKILINFYKSKIKNLCDKIEYFEIRSPINLSRKISKKNFKIFIAYYQENIRLIDNV